MFAECTRAQIYSATSMKTESGVIISGSTSILLDAWIYVFTLCLCNVSEMISVGFYFCVISVTLMCCVNIYLWSYFTLCLVSRKYLVELKTDSD